MHSSSKSEKPFNIVLLKRIVVVIRAHFDQFGLDVPPKSVFEQALERVWGNMKSQFNGT
jgi:hypothetical protein